MIKFWKVYVHTGNTRHSSKSPEVQTVRPSSGSLIHQSHGKRQPVWRRTVSIGDTERSQLSATYWWQQGNCSKSRREIAGNHCENLSSVFEQRKTPGRHDLLYWLRQSRYEVLPELSKERRWGWKKFLILMDYWLKIYWEHKLGSGSTGTVLPRHFEEGNIGAVNGWPGQKFITH